MREYYSLHKFCIETADGEDIAHLYLQECVLLDKEIHYLEDVWTHPDHRGNGYASLLVQYALEYVASDPYSFGMLATTRYGRKVGNTSQDLVQFYQNLGFRVIGYEDRYDRAEGNQYTLRSPIEDYEHYGTVLIHDALGSEKVSTQYAVIHRICPYDAQIAENQVFIDTTSLGGESRYVIGSELYLDQQAGKRGVEKYVTLHLQKNK